MATLKEVMRYALELDIKGFSKGLDDAERDAKSSFGDIEDAGQESSGRFEGLGGKMGKGLVAGFAAVGAGAIIVQQLDAAFAREGERNLVQGRFGLSDAEMRDLGNVAGGIYADGWGESAAEVTAVAAQVTRDIGTATEAELESVTTNVLAASKTFGVGFEEITRSVSQLLENDLAPSAEDALDLVVGAFQAGGDKAGDLLDTIDEYSQHWSAVGLDGEEALNQVIAGFQTGQRDADKMADAVKEMRLRIVEDSDPVRKALENIGLNADEVVQGFIAGGDVAKLQFQRVVEALQASQDAGADTSDAVAIIGTQFEDLGPKALQALSTIDGALDVTTGKAGGLAETVEATPWEQLQRKGESAISAIGDEIARQVLPPLEAVGTTVEWIGGLFGGAADEAEDFADDTTKAMSLVEREIINANNELKAMQWKPLRDDATSAMTIIAEHIADVAEGTDIASVNLRRFGTDGVEDMGKVETATDDAATSVSELETAFANLRESIRDKQEYEQLAETFKQFDEGKASVDDLRLAVLDYHDELDNLPEEVTAEILALIDEGSIAEAERRLASLERIRVARVAVELSGPSTYVPPSDELDRILNPPPPAPTPTVPRNVESFYGDSGPTYNVTVNAGMGTDGSDVGREVVGAIKDYERYNGTAWRES